MLCTAAQRALSEPIDEAIGMSQMMRLRFSRARAMLISSPQTSYLCSCAEAAHRASSYRGMLVRAHQRACSSLEHEPQVSRYGWHVKVHS